MPVLLTFVLYVMPAFVALVAMLVLAFRVTSLLTCAAEPGGPDSSRTMQAGRTDVDEMLTDRAVLTVCLVL
jgi:hypothetical protein